MRSISTEPAPMRICSGYSHNALIPVLEKHKDAFGEILDDVTADSGYCSEKNLLYLKEKKYPVTSSYRIMKSAKHVLTQKILGSIIT